MANVIYIKLQVLGTLLFYLLHHSFHVDISIYTYVSNITKLLIPWELKIFYNNFHTKLLLLMTQWKTNEISTVTFRPTPLYPRHNGGDFGVKRSETRCCVFEK